MPYEACFQLSHPLRFKTLGTNSWYQLIQATHEPMHSNLVSVREKKIMAQSVSCRIVPLFSLGHRCHDVA